MKISFASFLVVLATSILPVAAQEQMPPPQKLSDDVSFQDGFLIENEMDNYLQLFAQRDAEHLAEFSIARRFAKPQHNLGEVPLSPSLQERLMKSNIDINSDTCHKESVQQQQGLAPADPQVYVSLITGTSQRHMDFNANLRPAGDVAFIMLEDNPHAEFVIESSTGDTEEELIVPVEKNRLVSFPGTSLHHTRVSQGVVKLLGPFEVPSFLTVGPSDCVYYQVPKVVISDVCGGFFPIEESDSTIRDCITTDFQACEATPCEALGCGSSSFFVRLRIYFSCLLSGSCPDECCVVVRKRK